MFPNKIGKNILKFPNIIGKNTLRFPNKIGKKFDYPNEHLKGLRCSMKPYIDQGWMENIQLYSIHGYLSKQLQKLQHK